MLHRFARRCRHLALALAALALVSLGAAPFSHGAAAKLAGGAQDYCGVLPGGAASGGGQVPDGPTPLCPVCVAFSAADTLAPPAAGPGLRIAVSALLAPLLPGAAFVPDPSGLTPPAHAPPARG